MLTDLLRRCQDVLEGIVDEHDAPAYLQATAGAEDRSKSMLSDADHKPETLLIDVWIPQAVEALRPRFQPSPNRCWS